MPLQLGLPACLPAEPPALCLTAHANFPVTPAAALFLLQKLFSSIEEDYARKKELRQREAAQAAAALRDASAAAARREHQTSPAAAAAAAAAAVHAHAPGSAVLAAAPAQNTSGGKSSADEPPPVSHSAPQPPGSLPDIAESSVQQASASLAAPARQDASPPIPLPQAVLAAAAKGAPVS